MMPRLKLVGRILVAIGAFLVAGAFQLSDGAPGSPRAILGLVAGILMAVGNVLVLYGDGEGPSPPLP